MTMRYSKETLLAALAAGTFGVAGSAGAATILTGTGLGNNETVPAGHGSNAAGTPNVTLTWDTNWEAWAGWPNPGDDGVYQLDNQLDDPHTIIFTPDATYDVILTSFDMNDWVGGGGDSEIDWSVTGSLSGLLASGTDVVIPDGTVPAIAVGVTGTGSETLTLSITQTGGSASYLAMDNLSFDQVPEPGSAFLALGGLGAMTMRRKRK